MLMPGQSTALNPWTFVFVAESRTFIALMAGPFSLQLSAPESFAIASHFRASAELLRAGETHSTMTLVGGEIWHVVATDTGTVALLRKSVLLRFTPDEADACARLLDDGAELMTAERTPEVAHA